MRGRGVMTCPAIPAHALPAHTARTPWPPRPPVIEPHCVLAAPCPGGRREGIAGLRLRVALLLATLLLAMVPGQAAAATPAAGPTSPPAKPVRLGIYHPRPRLCLADEPSQRDLRVLRLAYGVARVPAQRLEWPWFYRALPWPPGAPRGLAVVLDSEALWGVPTYRLVGAQPDLPATGVDRLVAWRAWALARLPDAHPSELLSLAQLLAPLPTHDPFFASRLAGSELLPFDLGQDGEQPEDVCRRWPKGVTLLPASTDYAYELRDDRPDAGGPLHLFAYRERRALWRDYFRGRLDALLLEGADLDGELERLRASQVGTWGSVLGTQQIVLRFTPQLAARLGQPGRLALSLALPRKQLAQLDGPGRFAAAGSFLGAVRAPGAEAPAKALDWDTLSARRLWLEGKHELPELHLAVLDHPVLMRLANRIQAQWSKTLNLSVRVEVLTVEQFYRAIRTGAADISLDVMDLDDGSLQDLWLDTLRDLHAPLGGSSPRWEVALRKDLPYLPVLDNLHPVLLRRGAPQGLLERVCPGCVPADSPRHLAPEPQEQTNPQG